MEKKSIAFVIVHGAWQCSDGWEIVGKSLREQGYPVALIDLPGHGAHPLPEFLGINLQTYVNHVAKIIENLAEKAQIVLIGHSMAGMVISQVAEHIPVYRLIYVSAFLPIDGECLMDIVKHSNIIGISKNMSVNKSNKSIVLDKQGLERLFFNDCHPQIAQIALSRLQEEPLLPFYGKVHLTAEKFGKIPKSYIECLKDFSVGIDLQRFMNQRHPCEIRSLEAGHAPFYSVPEQLSQLFIDCVNS